MKPDILKSGTLILNKNKELLISKDKGKDIWIFVGGSIEDGETPEEALIREIKEELNVEVSRRPQLYLTSPIELAAGDKEGRTVQIKAYLTEIQGKPVPSSEIESIHWLTKKEYYSKKYILGSILQELTVPKLIKEGLM